MIMLVTVSVFAMYYIIDQGVTITYMKDGYSDTENDLDNLIKIINNKDLSKSEIKTELVNHPLYEFMNFNTDTVPLRRIMLIFRDDVLEKIEKQW